MRGSNQRKETSECISSLLVRPSISSSFSASLFCKSLLKIFESMNIVFTIERMRTFPKASAFEVE